MGQPGGGSCNQRDRVSKLFSLGVDPGFRLPVVPSGCRLPLGTMPFGISPKSGRQESAKVVNAFQCKDCRIQAGFDKDETNICMVFFVVCVRACPCACLRACICVGFVFKNNLFSLSLTLVFFLFCSLSPSWCSFLFSSPSPFLLVFFSLNRGTPR